MFERTTVVVVLRHSQFVVDLGGTAFVEPAVFAFWHEETFVPDEELDQPTPFEPVSTPFATLPTGAPQMLALMAW